MSNDDPMDFYGEIPCPFCRKLNCRGGASCKEPPGNPPAAGDDTKKNNDEAWRVYRLVREMRRAQKAYFASRKQADIIAAKRLEAAVDSKLSELGVK